MKSPSCLHVYSPMKSSSCLCVYPHINFLILEPIFMKLGMYIMTPNLISTA
jgi:hypothetical protein